MCVNKATNFLRYVLACLPAVLMFLYFSNNILAAVMSSTNYRIEADDSLTPIGGVATSSAGYVFWSTLGEFATGPSTSTLSSYGIKAGYQQMLEAYLTVSSPGDLTLSPDIPGMSGGTANASGSYNVITDSPSGFNMRISASTTPAILLGGNDVTHYFANYPVTATYSWSVASGNSQFGFTVEPATAADTAQAFLDNGSNACGTGSTNGTDTCWAGFNSTSTTTIINRTSRTAVAGESEKIKFRAQSNNNFLVEGTYSGTITVTVLQN